MEDADLVRLCQNGDVAAFEELFHRHQGRVYSVTRRMMNNEEDAEDLVQEIFLKAYQKIDKFKYTSAFSTWLYRLAVNQCIDQLRKRKNSVNAMPLEEAILQVDEDTPEDHALLDDRNRQIWSAINSLRDKERAIIILKDIEGLSYKEIAEVFKCSLGRVKSRLHEARQKLKAILEAETELLAEI